MNTLVSIIVPCYKVEQYLPECIESILQQTYKNLEIWLVNDGSPDHCGEICDDYAQKDCRIKVVHKSNGGLSDARNVAIDRATGEWITFIDSDDYVSPDYIETLYGNAIDNNCKCSVVQPVSFYDGKEPIPNIKGEVEILTAQEAVEAMFYQTKLDTSAWNKLYHRSLFETGIRYPKGLLFEDNPTTFRLMALCENVAISQKRLYYYRLRSESIEGSDFTSVKLDQGLQIIKMMENYPEITTPIINSLHCKQLSLAMHFIMKMPFSYSRKNELWGYVTQYRLKVMLDGKARNKTRIACLLSYMGIRVMKTIFVRINKRNRSL